MSTLLINSLDDIFVTLGDVASDVQIQTKANSQEYCVEVCDSNIQIPMQNVIALCNSTQSY